MLGRQKYNSKSIPTIISEREKQINIIKVTDLV